MRVNSCNIKTPFGAKLNENTRTLIRDFDKYNGNNLEGRIDAAIKNSPIGDFYGDKALISFVETQNPHCNISPVISIEINGITASHTLKGDSEICEDQDEEFLIEKMNRRPYRYMNTIVNRLNSESISQIKKYLAIDYLHKAGANFDVNCIDEKEFDLIFDA